jgi:hypothetical protein
MTPVRRRPQTFLLRSLLAAWLAVSSAAAVLWFVSIFFGSVGIFSLGHDTSLNFADGTAEVSRLYAFDVAPAVPEAQWHATAVSRGWTAPPRARAWDPSSWFGWWDNLVSGMNYDGRTIRPARYWMLRLPLLPLALPGIVAGAIALARCGRGRESRRRGFAIDAPGGPT